ncbi:MAG TPA: 16S rRNA (uracil(1498)-N(3))-methyltransferase [Blastocatellia bacterium]|nr:16S rRNA (uracil(1498)-N(3))-methyltransferase [Blastocatellia bacterium]HMX25496.1 16S rRNA (uracil(1498)-N(3))-methyltransferase [Blastocatellia bacterium]HMY74450.1 16S rRNA (uracil(1498)-N(3))-methyltransferase [Blastocatellia bacterium]HMZ19643.1 16S rRNA (uracil(1498)-N(3))-methyltransferase [Blastocatellia bacterium]HNG28983.1 16S rRNA (uracil(1498)-N(3))-methyltransferase [Blastocatellia bacterium]
MQRHRFYATQSQISDSEILLDGDESHHLARVLRLREGATVFAFDGEGREWECTVAQIGKRESALSIVQQLTDEVESPLHLTLAQALVKGDKFDWIVQKATELGVTRIVPLLTYHSDVRRAEERAEQRLQRWRRISLEALKQCGRRRVVEFAEPIGFADFCASGSAGRNLIFSERDGRPLRELAAELQPLSQLSVSVASEGGWSDAELNAAEANGFLAVHLGGRILRTETAAIAAVALAQHLFGDL